MPVIRYLGGTFLNHRVLKIVLMRCDVIFCKTTLLISLCKNCSFMLFHYNNKLCEITEANCMKLGILALVSLFIKI